MKRKSNIPLFGIAVLGLLAGIGGCSGAPAPAAAPAPVVQGIPLDQAIEAAAQNIEGKLEKGIKIATLNFSSASGGLSEYVLEELSMYLVNGGKLLVVDRSDLDSIRTELNFNLSGEVDDKAAQEMGRMLGAQYIVSGSLLDLGDVSRIRFKTIAVESAGIAASTSVDITNDTKVKRLLAIGGSTQQASAQGRSRVQGGNTASGGAVGANSGGSSGAASVGTVSSAAASQPSAPAAVSATSVPAPAVPAASQGPTGLNEKPGLYVNNQFQAALGLYDAIDWIALNVKQNGNYVIVLGRDEKVSYISFAYNATGVRVALKGSGGSRKITFDIASPTGPLFTVGKNVTFVLEDQITLTGLANNSNRLVFVDGGSFIMNDGTITGNKISQEGGAVYMKSGVFTMNGGTISGNTASGGGGVYVESGTFTMGNGIISGNIASGYGGGVFVSSGAFRMNGGTISGNTASNYYNGGGGVYVSRGALFTKSGTAGIIYGSNAPTGQANKAYTDDYGHAVYVGNGYKRNTTARISNAITTNQSGAAGGWE